MQSKYVSCARLLCALLLAPALTMGCASKSMPQSVPYRVPAPPADLAQPCADLPLIEQGDAQTVALWIVDAVEQYRDCQARHDGLVRAWPGQWSFSRRHAND